MKIYQCPDGYPSCRNAEATGQFCQGQCKAANTTIEANKMTEHKTDAFDEWAFMQCVVNGGIIDAIKDEHGNNIAWENRETGEQFVLPDNKDPII